jgi:hypothetical protein
MQKTYHGYTSYNEIPGATPSMGYVRVQLSVPNTTGSHAERSFIECVSCVSIVYFAVHYCLMGLILLFTPPPSCELRVRSA